MSTWGLPGLINILSSRGPRRNSIRLEAPRSQANLPTAVYLASLKPTASSSSLRSSPPLLVAHSGEGERYVEPRLTGGFSNRQLPKPMRGWLNCTVERSRRMNFGSYAGLCKFPKGTPGERGNRRHLSTSGSLNLEERDGVSRTMKLT